MSALYLILLRLLRINTSSEIPQIWMFFFLFGLDCRLIWFFWPF